LAHVQSLKSSSSRHRNGNSNRGGLLSCKHVWTGIGRLNPFDSAILFSGKGKIRSMVLKCFNGCTVRSHSRSRLVSALMNRQDIEGLQILICLKIISTNYEFYTTEHQWNDGFDDIMELKYWAKWIDWERGVNTQHGFSKWLHDYDMKIKQGRLWKLESDAEIRVNDTK